MTRGQGVVRGARGSSRSRLEPGTGGRLEVEARIRAPRQCRSDYPLPPTHYPLCFR